MDLTLSASRKLRRQKLTAIKEALNPSNPRLSEANLEEFGIRRTTLSLDGDSANGPEFFTAYKHAIHKPLPSEFDGYTSLDPEPSRRGQHYYTSQDMAMFFVGYMQDVRIADNHSTPANICYIDFGDLGFGSLLDLTRPARWGVHTVWHMPEKTAPHIVFVMYSEMTLDGYEEGKEQPLFWGEVSAIVRIMHRRLKLVSLRMNLLAPVFCFSAIGENHFRVIEAYHDGDNLVVLAAVDMPKRSSEPWNMVLFRETYRFATGISYSYYVVKKDSGLIGRITTLETPKPSEWLGT
ncbi:uncharacterized protein DSM5745_04462 [Aspergillus mulundensis]|uniref:Uncharacterized protein n=1 Tax=Aspergillus mulundensis TaxID=1810919 RepID=A0A3D8SCS3_9EURO|nr:hypothetical protein DSM5745_04462 [Aspergillus mulundensis]RDW84136.1 hypothetical protein DSM5745_04462 [Aspergillus mulundensis]